MHYRLTAADGSRSVGALAATHAVVARAELLAAGVSLAPNVKLELSQLPFPAIGSKGDVSEQAQSLLDASDSVIIRCAEHGVTVPDDWKSYRAALRALVTAPTDGAAMPAKPAYPAGT